MARPKKGGKKKQKKTVGFAIAHIQTTFNNTIITFTDKEGNTLCWESGGTVGFKGTRKGPKKTVAGKKKAPKK